MSKAYDEYLEQHIQNVMKGFNWMIVHDVLDLDQETIDAVRTQIRQHDTSKYEAAEYDAYDAYFYGKNGKTNKEKAEINESFDYAWLHHIQNNPHHWQHWVLIEDDGALAPLEMPESYVYEMIADWWTFSWKEGKLEEIFDWYKAHQHKITLHQDTQQLVENILDHLRVALKNERPDGY